MNFNDLMTKDLLFNIITEVHNSGFDVVSLFSELI